MVCEGLHISVKTEVALSKGLGMRTPEIIQQLLELIRPILRFLVSHHVLPLHIMRAGGYYHYM